MATNSISKYLDAAPPSVDDVSKPIEPVEGKKPLTPEQIQTAGKINPVVSAMYAVSQLNPYADEIAAAWRSLMGQGKYSDLVKEERERVRLAREAHPGVYGGTELVGNIGMSLAPVGAVASGVKSLLGSAAVGAGANAAMGYGRAEGDYTPGKLARDVATGATAAPAATATMRALGSFAPGIVEPIERMARANLGKQVGIGSIAGGSVGLASDLASQAVDNKPFDLGEASGSAMGGMLTGGAIPIAGAAAVGTMRKFGGDLFKEALQNTFRVKPSTIVTHEAAGSDFEDKYRYNLERDPYAKIDAFSGEGARGLKKIQELAKRVSAGSTAGYETLKKADEQDPAAASTIYRLFNEAIDKTKNLLKESSGVSPDAEALAKRIEYWRSMVLHPDAPARQSADEYKVTGELLKNGRIPAWIEREDPDGAAELTALLDRGHKAAQTLEATDWVKSSGMKNLEKYANRVTGGLDETVGYKKSDTRAGTRRADFQERGDQISHEAYAHGEEVPDTEDVRHKYDQYQAAKAERAAALEDVKAAQALYKEKTAKYLDMAKNTMQDIKDNKTPETAGTASFVRTRQAIDDVRADIEKYKNLGVEKRYAKVLGTLSSELDKGILKNEFLNPEAEAYTAKMKPLDMDTRVYNAAQRQLGFGVGRTDEKIGEAGISPDPVAENLIAGISRRIGEGKATPRDMAFANIMKYIDPKYGDEFMAGARDAAAIEDYLKQKTSGYRLGGLGAAIGTGVGHGVNKLMGNTGEFVLPSALGAVGAFAGSQADIKGGRIMHDYVAANKKMRDTVGNAVLSLLDASKTATPRERMVLIDRANKIASAAAALGIYAGGQYAMDKLQEEKK